MLLAILAALAVAYVFRKIFIVPRNLSHLPRVPVFALLKSYLSREEESQRIQRLILPFANERDEPIVLVWAFGLWIVHVLDHDIGRRTLQDRDWVRDLPPQDLLLWRFVGRSNLAFTIGDEWRKHSRVITNIFQGSPPLSNFTAIFDRLEEHLPVSTSPTTVSWDEWTERITLDVLGTTILGHDFQAISDKSSPILSTYRHVMAHITEPPYVFFPIFDKLFPRKELVRSVDGIRSHFQNIINEKHIKSDGGVDLISRMIAHPDFTQKDVLDNVAVLFIAGHETTAGALSSIIYYLAKHPSSQSLARSEVDRVLPSLPSSPDITVEILNRLPTVTACIQESMRMNNPSNFTLPRISNAPKTLGPYTIPPGTPMCFNISTVQHLERTFTTPPHDTFDPTRFLVYPTSNDFADEKTAGIPTASPLTNQTAFFGLGLRQCPARYFALWELRTLLTLLLHKYTWSLPDSSPHSDRVINAFSFGTNLNLPKDLDIIFTKRV